MQASVGNIQPEPVVLISLVFPSILIFWSRDRRQVLAHVKLSFIIIILILSELIAFKNSDGIASNGNSNYRRDT